MSPQNLPQILDFLVHAIEHLADRIDFHFAALKAFQREPDRQVLGQLHDNGLIHLRVWRFGDQTRKSLPQ